MTAITRRFSAVRVIPRLLPTFACYALVAALAYACRGVVTKAGPAGLKLELLMLMQSTLALPLLWGMARVKGQSLRPGVNSASAYASRVVWGICYQGLLLLAIKLMPLALATTLSYTTPLFLALLAPLLLKEKSTGLISGLTVMGFAGVALNALPYADQVPFWALGLGLLCGFAGSMMQIGVRSLALLGEPGVRGVFWMHAVTASLALIACFIRGSLAFTAAEFRVCAAIAVLSCVAQLGTASAYAHGKALPVNALSLLTLPLTVLLACIFLGETVSLLALAGIAIVMPACLLLVWAEQSRLRKLHTQHHQHGTLEELREEHAQIESGLVEPLFVSEPSKEELGARNAELVAVRVESEQETSAPGNARRQLVT